MATITPTSDQVQWPNVTTFRVGDRVQSNVDNRIGVIITPQGLLPTVVGPGPTIAYLPVPLPPIPLATPANPITSNVEVRWFDGTVSTVALSTLRRPAGL